MRDDKQLISLVCSALLGLSAVCVCVCVYNDERCQYRQLLTLLSLVPHVFFTLMRSFVGYSTLSLAWIACLYVYRNH